MTSAEVPAAVRAAFALDGEAEQLAGGMAPAFRIGEIVVKTVNDDVEASYIAEVMDRVQVDERVVRVARPVPSCDGAWVAPSRPSSSPSSSTATSTSTCCSILSSRPR